MLANEDIYTGSIDPTPTVNPKTLGALYINYATGKMWVCADNTLNNNRWVWLNPPPKEPEVTFGENYEWIDVKTPSQKWWHNRSAYPWFLNINQWHNDQLTFTFNPIVVIVPNHRANQGSVDMAYYAVLTGNYGNYPGCFVTDSNDNNSYLTTFLVPPYHSINLAYRYHTRGHSAWLYNKIVTEATFKIFKRKGTIVEEGVSTLKASYKKLYNIDLNI